MALTFIGNLVLDIIIATASYPAEDSKTRTIKPPVRSVGGNAANSALVASALLHVLTLAERNHVLRDARTHLIAADVGDGADADSVRAYLRSTRLNVHHPPSSGSLPTSYIITSAESQSRTIVHNRPSEMNEMSADSVQSLLQSSGLYGSSIYVHCELRDVASCSSFLSNRAVLTRAIIAVELERIRGTDTVEDARALLRRAPHIAIVSRELAAEMTDARKGEDIIAALEDNISDGALLVIPLGADGVIASLALRASFDAEGAASIAAAAATQEVDACVFFSSGRFHVRFRLRAHVPAGGIVSTIGAGDSFNAALAIAMTHAPTVSTWWAQEITVPAVDFGAALGASLAFAVFVAGESCSITLDNATHRAELLAQKLTADCDDFYSAFSAVTASATAQSPGEPLLVTTAPLKEARAPVTRHFIVPFSRVPPRWPAVRDLERTRADVLIRALVSSIMVSRGARGDTTFAGALLGGDGPPLSILACGAHVRALRPDESSTAGLLHRALPASGAPDDLDELEANGTLNSRQGSRACCTGLRVLRGGLIAVINELSSLAGSSPVLLIATQGATPISVVLAQEASRATGFLILLGDDAGLTDVMLSHVAAVAVRSRAVGLGPTELLASAAITLIHAAFDNVFGPSSERVRQYDEKIVCRVCEPA